MREWKLVRPEATTNRALNPSGEIAGNFGAVGGGTATRVTTYAKYGVYSYRVQTAGNDEGISLTLATLANAAHYATLLARGTIPEWDWSLDDATYTEPEAILAIDAEWTLYGLAFPAGQAVGSTTLYIRQNGAGVGDFYVDGVQVEQLAYWTTYCDGEQEGCAWNGAPHASTSSRSAMSRAGGRVLDFEDYELEVIEQMGIGAAPITLHVDEYALLPGGQLNAAKVRPRSLALVAQIQNREGDLADLHAYRQALVEELAHDRYPAEAAGWQPVRLRYTGAAVAKEIRAHYREGLGLNWRDENVFAHYDKFGLQFLAPDPHWRELGESAAVLDVADSATLRYVAGRLRATGQWDDLGLTNNPTTGGAIRAIKYNPFDGRVYVGGVFTSMNGVAGRNYVAVYDPATDTWSTLGAGGAVNAAVYAIAIAPNGDVYFGGAFSNLGDANGDYVAYWDLSAGAWASLAGGGTATVHALAFGPDGMLYIGGDFANWAGTGANYAVKWNGAAYAVMDAGNELNSSVWEIAVHPNGDVYLGGLFTQFGATVCNYWVRYDGTDYQVISTSLNGSVSGLDIGRDGMVYVGGAFTSPTSYIGMWDGQQLVDMGGGTDATVYFIKVGPDGMVYAAGSFDEAGGIALADYVGRWNGYSWAHLDLDLPGSNLVYCLEVATVDPIVERNYDLYIGFDVGGVSTIAGLVTVSNDGTAPAYPRMVVTRTGGTGATLASMRNEMTGKELLFDYALLDGETLTIDLAPTEKSIVSSMFGPRMGAALANSDFGQFCLLPGENPITCFVIEAGGPTVAATMVWRDAYLSCD